MKLHLGLAAAALALAPVAPAQATIVFSDDFDAEGATATNYTGFAKWTVSDGTVDLVGMPNGFGISCAGGTGSCVDLDGSTGDAGVMTAKGSWVIGAADFWTIKFDVSGSQRGTQGSATDTVQIGLLFDDATTSTLTLTVPFNFSMTWFTLGGSGKAGTVQLFMKGIPESQTDNVGLIVDNVSLDIAYAVPEPASWLMMITGFGLAGAALRRRKMAFSYG